MNVRIRLDGHEFVHAHRARFADSSQIVALEIDEHDVLRALLRMRREFGHLREISAGIATSGPRAGNRAGVDPASVNTSQTFG